MRRIPEPPSVAGTLARPVREFLATEASGGLILLAAALVAVVWANSPWDGAYRALWSLDLKLSVGAAAINGSLRLWVNEGLMAVFFLVVGLEIRREMYSGELRDPKRAALPVIAALGGMIVPALLFLAFNPSGAAERGWGIPMATDIALTLGVVALLARHVPSPLRVFLLALAVVDDLGAVVVLAVFYAEGIKWRTLGVAVALLALIVVLKRMGVRWTPLFVGVGAAVWLATHEAGVHATLAGVAMGLLAPVTPALPEQAVATLGAELADVSSPEAARTTVRLARLSVPVVEWLEHVLHPWTSYLVVPLFALANFGIRLDGNTLRDSVTSPVTLGVVVGLVLGKLVGVSAFAWMACRLGLAVLPTGTRWRQVMGVAALAGIGFTVSLFFTDLSLADPELQNEAKVGILVASLVAAGVGSVLLRGASTTRAD